MFDSVTHTSRKIKEMTIASRVDLLTAKALLDNLDQVNAAILSIGTMASAIVITLPQHPNVASLSVPGADAVAFLEQLETKLIAQLTAMGVTSL